MLQFLRRRRAGKATDAPESQALPAAAPPTDEARRGLHAALALRRASTSAACRERLAALIEAHGTTPEADCARGTLCLLDGRHAEALPHLERALDALPDLAAAHLGLAEAHLGLGRLEEASDGLHMALHHEPGSVAARLLLARLHLQAGLPEQALVPCREACDLAPQSADAWFAHALAAARAQQIDVAAQSYERVLALDPADVAAHVNLGLIHLQDRGDPAAAEACFRSALAADPASAVARANLGLALQDQGRVDEALALYEAAIAAEPAFVEYRWNRALALLGTGRFDVGWDDYELRDRRAGANGPRAFPLPAWEGQALAGHGLLVTAEQGVGDEIMFASCVPDLVRAGARIALECDPRLASLFARSFPQVAVVGAARGASRDWLRDYPWLEWRVPAGTLPGRLRRSVDAFPSAAGYLLPEPVALERARAWLAGLGPGRKVGLSWRGGTRATRAALRSVPLDECAAWVGASGLRFVCLQHGLSADERCRLEALGMVMAPALQDMEALAALLVALDEVVTVANTVAHLAGALGVRAQVLVSAMPEWRWMPGGSRSFWYPSLRLLRQARGEGWAPVLAAAARGLDAPGAGAAA